MPKNIIFMSPSVEWVKEKLIQRWTKEKMKWREDNFDYLEAVHAEFLKFYENHNANILKIIDTNLQNQVSKINEWIINTVYDKYK